MSTFLAVVIGLGAALLLLTAGYLFGAAKGSEARKQLRERADAADEELTRLRERLTKHARKEDSLRGAIEKVLSPLVQREHVALGLASLETPSGAQRNLRALLDQIAEKGNLSAVLLGDEQGLPLAASSGARDLERLGATAALMRLLADRMRRDDAPEPRALMVQDADNTITLSRLFTANRQRLSLTAVSVGGMLTPAALDPALVKLNAALLSGDRSAEASVNRAGGLG
ncbi:MAG: hypothetical protein IPM15_15890 [Betaproteobacteria bacterium]|nr:hypothetical protein [Betaproteobacteria bacterium]